MEKTFEIVNPEISLAAVEDAVNFGLKAYLKKENDKNIVVFETSVARSDYMGDSPTVKMDDVYSVLQSYNSEMQYQLKWIREDFSSISKRFEDHMNGHIPAIKDAGKLQAAINTLGLGDSFQVQKPSVYVQY